MVFLSLFFDKDLGRTPSIMGEIEEGLMKVFVVNPNTH